MEKYDYQKLKLFCDKKNIMLIKDYSKEPITSRTSIEFKCVMIGCENTHITRFSNFINNKNAYCESCKKESKRERVIIYEKMIAYTHPEIAKQWHPTKNGELKPEHFTYGTEQKIWWFSNECKHDWDSQISNRTGRGDGCTKCINKTEQKLYDELSKYYPLLKQQFKVEWCKNKKYLPYDFVLEDNKIIIEIDGEQHFKDIISWNSSLKDTHENDIYKMKCANENGFSVIRIFQPDIWNDSYDWFTELRENIEKIKLEQRVQNVYMCKDNEYAIFT